MTVPDALLRLRSVPITNFVDGLVVPMPTLPVVEKYITSVEPILSLVASVKAPPSLKLFVARVIPLEAV